MPSCAFLKCKNNNRNKNKSLGITFHTFPRDLKMRKTWIDIIRLSRRDEEWEANQFSRICSNHFEDNDMYLTSKGFRKIKKTGVPISHESQKPAQIFLPASSPFSNDSVSSFIFNSPQTSEYLKKIDRLTHENKICKMKIKSMRQRHNLLQKKMTEMKSSIQTCTITNTRTKKIKGKIKRATQTKCTNRTGGVLKKKKYPPSLPKFASTLNFYSPAAYKYVRRVFAAAIYHHHFLQCWMGVIRRRPDLLLKLFKA